jgi:hypothetical protein
MELKALSRLGWSVTALAREYGLSRTTVYKELASPGPRSYGRAKPTELNEAQRIHIERRLSVCPGIRGTDLHAEPAVGKEEALAVDDKLSEVDRAPPVQARPGCLVGPSQEDSAEHLYVRSLTDVNR